MQNRRKKIARILEVRRQMHRIEEWKLASISRRGTELGEQQGALIDALNRPGDFQALFADTLARRLNRLSQEAAHVEREEAAQAQRLLAEARYLKTAERLSHKVEKEARREREKLEFRSILETLAAADDASST